MPYKSKKKRAEYMRKYREKKKKELQKLKQQFPDVYTLVFGKPKPKKKKKGKRHL